MNLQFKTRGMSDPKGKPKVYFSCHPEDFNEVFPLISDDLLNHANCAVWYDAELGDLQNYTEDYSVKAQADELKDIL